MHDAPVTLAAFTPHDLEPAVKLLRRCLPLENVTVEQFARRVLLDPNFDRGGAIVARSRGGEIVGFVLAMAMKDPSAEAPEKGGRGYITLFAAAPDARGQGVGGSLLSAAETWLAERGCSSVWISPYAPGYWTPGIDEAAYPEAVAWLHKRGYATVSRPLSMAVDLDTEWGFSDTAASIYARLSGAGVSTAPFTPANVRPILDFLTTEFSEDWVHTARETMKDILAGYRPADAIWAAMRGEKCIGFAQFAGERFGPIGVAASERGRGVGTALMVRVLQTMRQSGCSRAFFLWTSDATAEKLYRPAGFAEARRFQIMKKQLGPA